MSTVKSELHSSRSGKGDDLDFVTIGIERKKKKCKGAAKKGKFSLTKLRKKFLDEGFGSQFERKEEGSPSSERGYHQQGGMATTQPSFVSGGDGGPSSIGQQNGAVIEVSLESPTPTPGPGEATARVVAQVLVSNADRENGQPHFIALSGPGSRSYTSLTPVNPAGVPDGEGGAVTQQGVQFVHYVDGGADQPIYQANGQMSYPVYTVGGGGGSEVGVAGTMYSSGPAYYAGSGPGAGGGTVAYTSGPGGGAYLLHQHETDADNRDSPTAAANQADGGGYLVTGDDGGTAGDGGEHGNLSHANRVSPATLMFVEPRTPSSKRLRPVSPGGSARAAGLNGIYRNPSYLGMVQWLLENYETAEGVSLPRSTLYNHYLRHCSRHKLEPVNAASFGKLIRSVFLGLRTRRLGTRGNSKYHYYGIRIKPGSTLNVSLGDEDGGLRSCKRYKGQKEEPPEHGSHGSDRSGSLSPQANDDFDDSVQVLANSMGQRQSQGVPSHLQYLGDASRAVPNFPTLSLPPDAPLPADCTLEDVDTLRSMYREHCEAFLDAVVNLELSTIESLWREFWRAQDNNNGDECEEEKYLSKTKLYELCKCVPVQDFVRRVDFLFYQNLVQVLIPDVLCPIPSTLTQSIRNFAKGLECWLTAAMAGVPVEMTRLKVSAVGALAQTLRRYTSLNHLAQAARAVLQNAGQIGQMLLDLNRVDFHNVQEQASWVCQCDDEVVQRLENDFKLTLQRQNSLEQWAGWLKGVVTQVLKPYEGKPSYAKAARQFLLKWSFYSSMVIRDLTLRSAASFGSFHLIRLLYDEYMFYLVEHQVARETGETPIAVMGEQKAASASAQDPIESLFVTANCNGTSPIKLDPGHPSKRAKIS